VSTSIVWTAWGASEGAIGVGDGGGGLGPWARMGERAKGGFALAVVCDRPPG
jgi:hypothetical protein